MNDNKGLLELLNTGDHSDYTITCGDINFKVHKLILRANSKSEFLKTCIDGPFAEATQNTLVVKETTPAAVSILLLCIYGGADIDSYNIHKLFDSTFPHVEESTEFIEDLVSAYVLADRFLMADAKSGLVHDIYHEIDMNFDESADEHVAHNLKCIYAAKTSDDSQLRNTIMELCIENRASPLLHKDHAVRKLVEELDPRVWAVGFQIARGLDSQMLAMFATTEPH
jgi:hypothetical protein